MKIYRNGPLGALMDEYERVAGELVALIEGISGEEYEVVRDPETEEDCRSIQAILEHVVRAGYGHAGLIRDAWGIERIRRRREVFPHFVARNRIADMLAYTSETLDGKWGMTDEEIEAVRIRSGWGPVSDLEQLLEHMIVHVLRHRRQIERFLGR